MSSPMITPDASFSEQARKSLQNDLSGLNGMNGASQEAKAKKLREACEGFESIFIQKMWQEMRNTVPKGGMLQGREERFWQDMYDQELAKSMTRAGGIGLADMMYEQLSSNLANASKTTAGQGTLSGFTPDAAPLLPQPAPQVDEPVQEVATAAPTTTIYEGEAPATGNVPIEETIPVTPPVTPKVEEPKVVAEAKPARTKKVKKTGTAGDSPLDLAYLARREAGDKLGNRAIRPALQPKKHKTEPVTAQAETQPVMNPGSADALKAAVETARTGAMTETDSQRRSIQEIVADAKLHNAQAAAEAAKPHEEIAQAASPLVRKVRVTTNTPQKQNSKKSKEAIRLLNVDNVGVNSKAGKGLAAYHAAQEAAQTPPRVQPAAEASAPAQPIQPLTAQESATDANFTIPPLTVAENKG